MISVVIPSYNCEKYLAWSVKSALCQTVSCPVEVIIVDDGSTDGTGELCRWMMKEDSRVRLLATPGEGNCGMSVARNVGLEAAAGELIYFLDADDILPPDALEYLLGLLEEYEADVVTSDYLKIDFSRVGILGGYIPSRFEIKGRRTPEITLYDGAEMAARILYRRIPGDNSAWGKLFRRELLGDNPFPPGKLYEDLFAVPEIIARAKRAVASSRPLYFYVQRPGSILHTFNEKREDVLDATCYLREKFAVSHPEISRAAESREVSAAFNLLFLIHRLPKSSRLKYARIAARAEGILCELASKVISDPGITPKLRITLRIYRLTGLSLLYPLSRLFYR